MSLRPLSLPDLDAYLDHVARLDRTNGADGRYFSPFSRHRVVDRAAARQRAQHRWLTPLSGLGWRRAWGWHADGALIGHLYLEGSPLASASHRVGLGMGIEPPHRGRGGGTRLLAAAIGWARAQPGIDWIDLGVFEGNPAQRLYARLGFTVQGHVPDRFRVDGVSIADTQMSLDLRAPVSDR